MSGSTPPEWHLMDQTLGYFYSAALRAATRLGVADQLADSARTPDELAEKVGADGSSVHRLLRLLATRGTSSPRTRPAGSTSPRRRSCCGPMCPVRCAPPC